jgi:2',3'-cyclic-nucleotide 2'-phosphodiesterase (5'-nucleotidase family)
MRFFLLLICAVPTLFSAPSFAIAGQRVEAGLPLADPTPGGAEDLLARVLFTSNQRGEFEPCTCPEVPLGGISQAVAQIDSVRADGKPVFWLDSGDRFFRIDMALLSTDEAERRLRAMLLVDSANLGGMDAMGVGRLDLGAGLDYLQKLAKRASFPILSANLVDADGKLLFRPSVMLERGGLRVGVTSVLPDDVLGDRFRALPARRAVRQQVKELRAAGAMLVVVLSNLGDEADRRLARSSGADVILGSRTRRLTPRGERVAKAVIGEAGARGRYLGDLRWYGKGKGKGPHLVLTTQPVHSSGARSLAVDALVEEVLRRLADPVLGVPPIPYQLQDDPRRGGGK